MIKILFFENTIIDIDAIYRELDSSGLKYTATLIKLKDQSFHRYKNYAPDIILSGYSAQQNTEERALETSAKLWPAVPLILIAEHIEIDRCVALVKKGISDIVLLQNISSLAFKISNNLLEDFPQPYKFITSTQNKHGSEQSKYSNLIQNSTDAILVTIKDGDIHEANPAACKMFRMTESEIISAGRTGLVHNDSNLARLLQERDLKGVVRGQLTFKRKDSSLLVAEITSVVFRDILGYDMTAIIIKDLTLSKSADKHLANTKAELQEAVHSMNKVMNASMDLIFSTDAEKKIVRINSACKSILGYDPNELLNKSYVDLLHREDKKTIFQIDQNIRKGNALKNFEASVIHKNGTTVNIIVSAQWDEDDKFIYCTAKDITENKKLEKAYEIERQRLLDIYHLSPACMAILKGPNHIHELTNTLYLKFLNKNDVLGKSVLEVCPEMESQGIIKLLDQVYVTGKQFIANEMCIQIDLDNNGLLIDTYMNFIYQAHRNSLGKIDGVFVFAIDVTEQVLARIQIEESEKLYHQLISELPVAAYLCDASGNIVFYNKAAAILWGTKPKIGKNTYCGFSEIFDIGGQTIPFNKSPMAISLSEGRIVSGWSGTVERADGTRRYVINHVVPYIDSLGQVTGAVNMITDITDTKNAKRALELQNKELAFENKEKEKRAAELAIANSELSFQNTQKEERAKELILTNIELRKVNKELDRFVYSVSHDLRSPLTSVQGLVSIIEDESQEPETLKHIQMISNSIGRLDSFIRKILSYSQNNRTSLDIDIIDVKQTVINIIESLQNIKEAKGIKFNINISEPFNLYTDKLRFSTILENLISNAIKYHKTNDTERFIKIKAVVEKNMVHIEIADNGIGIPIEFHDKIFDMFFRISSKSAGSGIGLYIVKDTVEKLEGTIRAISPIQGGTVFKIELKNLKTC